MDDERDEIPFEDAESWGGDDCLIDLFVVDDEIIGVIPIERLGITDPLKRSPWYDGQDVSLEGVLAAIEKGELEVKPYPGFSWSGDSEWDSRRHEARIAYLVKNPALDAISIEFNDLEMASMEVYDGWHRIAAAMVRGDVEIKVAVGGCFRHAVSRIGAICREYQRIGRPEAEMIFARGG